MVAMLPRMPDGEQTEQSFVVPPGSLRVWSGALQSQPPCV